MSNPATRYIPNTITLLNLLSGCLSCIFAFRHNEMVGGLYGHEWVYLFIGAAAVFDFCDGAAARLLHQPSPIGKELDSLSDLVSFGLAPAMLMFNLMQAQQGQLVWVPYIALMIPAMGALRLAIFNVDDSQATTFRGLPIPANAIFWIGFCGWMQSYRVYPGDWVVVLLIILVSLSMVSRMEMFSLKFKNFGLRDNFRRYIILIAAISFVAIYGIAGLAWVIVLYFVLSALTRRHQA